MITCGNLLEVYVTIRRIDSDVTGDPVNRVRRTSDAITSANRFEGVLLACLERKHSVQRGCRKAWGRIHLRSTRVWLHLGGVSVLSNSGIRNLVGKAENV
jgi:hypothetical protein